MAVVQNAKLLEVIVDAGESAKSLTRPGLRQVISLIEGSKVQAVVVAKLDRLTRSVKDLCSLLELFEKRHVALISVAESLDTSSAAGRLVITIMGQSVNGNVRRLASARGKRCVTSGTMASESAKALTKKEAEVERDKVLLKLNTPTVKQALAKGPALFGEVARMYKESHLSREDQISRPTRLKEESHLDLHIIPKWGEYRLNEISPREVEDWLYQALQSWWMRNAVRHIMARIYRKAEEWGYWEEGKRSPIERVKIGKKAYKRPRQILSMDQTARVLARLEDPYLLVIETCIATSTRISEVLGLQWKHVDLNAGAIRIEQRSWHQDIAAPKTESSRRLLALGHLRERFKHRASEQKAKAEDWVFAAAGSEQAAMGF